MGVLSEIPPDAQAEAEAARAWFSGQHNGEFKITGFVEGDENGADGRAADGQVKDLQLILCGELKGEEVCLKERFRVTGSGDTFEVTHVPEPPGIASPAPELDPPVGSRRGWLDSVLADSEFTVLLFYRGLW